MVIDYLNPSSINLQNTRRKEFYYKYDRGWFNGELIAAEKGPLHYGYKPLGVETQRACNLQTLECLFNLPDIQTPGVVCKLSNSGDLKFYICRHKRRRKKLKPGKCFMYETKCSYESATEITKKDLDTLSIEEYKAWLKEIV